MPIIEYIHSTKVYRVTVARTVEWGTQTYARTGTPYAPFLGVGPNEEYDCKEFFEYPIAQQKEAFAKMATLWADWQRTGFPDVVHA